jgi:hypothetical protein
MTAIKRKAFLKMGALVMLGPLTNSLLLQAAQKLPDGNLFTDDLLRKLVAANDKQVAGLLQSVNESNINFSRKMAYDFAALSASYTSPGSKYYHSNLIIPKLDILTAALISHQSADGTVNVGNLESPPDTAFLVEILSAAAFILGKDNSPDLNKANTDIKKFLVNAGNALTTGGVHTPNHRWVICAALARLNALYPNKKYVARINEWLSEGVFMDADGHYPERSGGIYGGVENSALITVARLLQKPQLLQYVRKNLDMTLYYTEPNGDVVTVDSRRQDQYMKCSIVTYNYINYRYMAINDGNKQFAAIAAQMESMNSFEQDILNKNFFHFLDDELLQKPLPEQAAPNTHYEKLFPTSHLLRVRRENTTVTLFGGVDWPLTIASGRSNSPNFFSYRKGNAILKYMRLSSGFFSMGYFYSEGIKKEGNKYILHKKLEVPYYQPLPKNLRNSKGDYKLSPSIDNRFWNKMDFQKRSVSNVKTLETTISLTETNGAVELEIRVSGLAGVSVTIELCFSEGGKLSGVTKQDDRNSFLENGEGKYESGGDTIHFGPGTVAHKKITELEGERYSTHFGNLRTEGQYVYLTGTTPFTHKLKFS